MRASSGTSKYCCYHLPYLLAILSLCLGRFNVTVTPPSGSHFTLHSIMPIRCSLTNTTLLYMNARVYSNFYLGIRQEKNKIASRNVVTITFNESTSQYLNNTSYFKLGQREEIPLNGSEQPFYTNQRSYTTNFVFTTEMIQIGYGKVEISFVEETQYDQIELSSDVYLITSTRQVRLVDIGFNVAIMILAILNTFALGCVADVQSIKNAVKQRLQMLIALITQYMALPLMTFGLVKISGIQNELALGLLLLVCVPGGGLGYLTVSVTGNTDKQYSVLLNVMQLAVPIVVMPLYVYSMEGSFLNGAGEVAGSSYYLVIWLMGLPLPFIIGMLIKHKKQELSDGILNWLIKPCLLLAFILFITLGLYINMYVFSVLDNAALVTGGVIPFMGFGIGGGLMLLAKQGKNAAKTLAIEATIMNSIVVMVIVRFTLPQPDADLTSAVAMWVLFFTPIPFVIMFIFHRIKRKIMFHFKKKSLENEQKTTIMTSFAAITRNAMQIGGLDRHAMEDETPSPHMNYYGAESRLLISNSQNLNDHPHAVTNNVSFHISTPVEEDDAEISGAITK